MNRILSKPLVVVLTILLCAVIGAFLSLKIPLSLYPTISKPTVQVTVDFEQGLEQFKSSFGKKIEASFVGLSNVKQVFGEYKSNRARYYVEFDWHVPQDEAIKDLSIIASFYQSQLPRTLPPIRVEYSDPSSECYLAIKPEGIGMEVLRSQINQSVLPKLRNIDGVSRAWLSDFGTRKILITLNPMMLLEYRIELTQVQNILAKMEFDVSLGTLVSKNNGAVDTIYASGVKQVADIESVVVSGIGSDVVKLSDIASIEVLPIESQRYFQLNGDDVLAIAVWPEPGRDLHNIASEFIRITTSTLDDRAQVIVLNNPARFINETLATVFMGIAISMLISAIVVLLLLQRLKIALLVTTVIPLSLLCSVICMYLAKVNFNLLSLAAIGVSTGMVIDGAVLVLDNISRVEREYPLARRLDNIIQAVDEIKSSLYASTFTTVIVFLPLVFTAPMASTLLKDISLVVVVVMLFSLLINLLVVPCLYILTARRGSKQESIATPRVLSGLQHGFLAVFHYLLRTRHSLKSLLVLIFALSTAGAWVVVDQLPRELIAAPQAEIVDVHLTFNNEGLPLEKRKALLSPLKDRIVKELQGRIKYLYSDYRQDDAYISIHLTDYRALQGVLSELKRIVRNNDAYTVDIQPWVTASMSVPDVPDIRIYVSGNNQSARRRYIDEIRRYLSDLNGVERVRSSPSFRQRQVAAIRQDYRMVNAYFPHSSATENREFINEYLGLAIEEKKLFALETDEGWVEVRVSLGRLVSSPDQIGNLPAYHAGTEFMLRDLVDLDVHSRWRDYATRNANDEYVVEAWLNNSNRQHLARLKEDLRGHLKTAFDTTILPLSFGEPNAEIEAGLLSVGLALALTVILVFLYLLSIFNCVSSAILALSTVPFSVIGVALGLYGFDSTLSMNSLLGVVMLCGISVNNSIIFLDCFNRLRPEMDGPRAAGEALRRRLRPIFITTITTAFGMIPISLGNGAGGKILQPLGLSIMFGLLTSTIIFLVLVPLAVARIESMRERKAGMQ